MAASPSTQTASVMDLAFHTPAHNHVEDQGPAFKISGQKSAVGTPRSRGAWPSYRIAWWLVFALMSGPLVWLGVLAFAGGHSAIGGLGANPIEFIIRYLGDWALRALLVALAATPLKIIFGWTWPVRMRRMLGLWAFFYVCLHLSTYIGVDQFFDWTAIGKDIVKRTYITVGMATVAILAALAITSPRRMVKKLGAKNWQRLHKLVYLAGVLGCVHYYMMVKADTLPPIIHASVLGGLLGVRVWQNFKNQRSTNTPARAPVK